MPQPPDSSRASPRIFTSQALAEGLELQLEEGPSRHLTGALRLLPGASICLFDGSGGEYAATISLVERKRVSVQVGAFNAVERESSLRVELAIAVSRGERMDFIVQKCTELGVSRISPLLSERTEVKLKGERLQKKIAHWQQVASSACEQCGRNRVPQVAELQPLSAWIAGAEAEHKLVLHHRSPQSLQGAGAPASVALLVGPEGGLSAAEIEAAEQAGFQALALGPRILRTETAPIAALSILNYQWGDMH
ncbi:MAG: 16S rRNA (uracil(1498)-N(3))-methyltransferase [Halieaceae bacterium]